MSPRLSLPVRRRGIALILVVLLGGLFLALSWHVLLWWTHHFDLNGERLLRSFALREGTPLYPGKDAGVLLNTIYGPVGAIAYLPATLAQRPAEAMVIGQTLAACFYYVPVLWLLFRGARGFRSLFGAASAFFLFAACTLSVKGLEYVAYSIHVDAPMLGAMALGAGVWLGRVSQRDRCPPSSRHVVAAIFCALALWTKQVAFGLPLALLVHAALVHGRRCTARLAVSLAGVGAASLALVILVFGPFHNLWLNLITVPSSQMSWGDVAFSSFALALRRVLAGLFPLVVLWGVAATLAWYRGTTEGSLGRLRAWARDDPSFLFALVALFQLPSSVLSSLKVAGDVNTFSFTGYPLAIGAVLSLAEHSRSSAAREPAARWLRGALPVIALLCLATLTGVALHHGGHWHLDRSQIPAEVAFDFARDRPGTVYFPFLGHATYLAEGKLYHSGDGVIDRDLAGMAPSAEHLGAHLPAHMRALALAPTVYSVGKIRYFDRLHPTPAPDEPALPVFHVFSVRPISDLSDSRSAGNPR